MVLNRQNHVWIDLAATRVFVARLRRALNLRGNDFNVCFVGDRALRRMNVAYRGKSRTTDVLSFPWQETDFGNGYRAREFSDFLGDVVISAETARRNALREGHSTANEIRWLILHGVLHLLGYDHEIDKGEMTGREHALRVHLGIAGSKKPRSRASQTC